MTQRCTDDPGQTHHEGCPCSEAGWAQRLAAAESRALQAEAANLILRGRVDALVAVSVCPHCGTLWEMHDCEMDAGAEGEPAAGSETT